MTVNNAAVLADRVEQDPMKKDKEVACLGFRVQGLGFRVSGLGFRA